MVKKLLLTLFVLSVLFMTGCAELVMVPCLIVAEVSNSIEATVGEHIDAYSDSRPRTVFSLEVLREVPFEKLCEYQGYQYMKPDCRFVILYRRKGKLIWPMEFYLDWRYIGSEWTRTQRYIPEYRIQPVIVLNKRICLVSPDIDDKIVILSASNSLREIRAFTVPFSNLEDFNGSYDKTDLKYRSCFFSGMFGKRFPHKVIKIPSWNRLSPLDDESKKYYLEKIYTEYDRTLFRNSLEKSRKSIKPVEMIK